MRRLIRPTGRCRQVTFGKNRVKGIRIYIKKIRTHEGGAGIEQDEEETTLTHLEVYEEREKIYPRFGMTGRLLEFRFKPMSDEANPAIWLEVTSVLLKYDTIVLIEIIIICSRQNGMRELLGKVLVDVSSNDWVGMVLTSENFVERPLGFRSGKEARCRWTS